jgi:hypothetical protein
MGQDFPDWGGQYNNQDFYPLFDLAELAVRLGSSVTFDRRGSVIWFDTFEYGLGAWGAPLCLGGGELSLTAERVELPPFAANLTTGAGAGSGCNLYREEHTPRSPTLGMSAGILYSGNIGEFYLEIGHFQAGSVYTYRLIIDVTNNNVDILTDGGVVTIDSGSVNAYFTGIFGRYKFVIDLDNHRYVRAQYFGTELDLSDYSPSQSSTFKNDHLKLLIQATTDSGVEGYITIDNVILTAQEQPGS